MYHHSNISHTARLLCINQLENKIPSPWTKIEWKTNIFNCYTSIIQNSHKDYQIPNLWVWPSTINQFSHPIIKLYIKAHMLTISFYVVFAMRKTVIGNCHAIFAMCRKQNWQLLTINYTWIHVQCINSLSMRFSINSCAQIHVDSKQFNFQLIWKSHTLHIRHLNKREETYYEIQNSRAPIHSKIPNLNLGFIKIGKKS